MNAILPSVPQERQATGESADGMPGSAAAARRWAGRLSTLTGLSPLLAEECDEGSLLERFCVEASTVMDARGVAVGIDTGELRGGLRLVARGLDQEAEAGFSAIDIRSGWLGEAAAGGQMVNIRAATAVPKGGMPPGLLQQGPLLLVPLRPISTGQGWIVFCDRPDGGDFDSQDEMLARSLAVQLAQSVENLDLKARLGEYSRRQAGGGEGERERERVAALSRRLVAVQEEERRRLASVVHDLISPNLAVAKLHLRTLGAQLPIFLREAMGTRLEDTAALLDDAAACMRDLSADLRPAMLDFGGLFAAVDGYAQLFSSRSGIEVELRGNDPGVRLSGEVESALFRIVQEALHNCAKHARATRVSIELRHHARHAILVVLDDGVGLIPEALEGAGGAGGWGLLTMRERAEFVGGRFRLDSRPGEGTRIAVEI